MIFDTLHRMCQCYKHGFPIRLAFCDITYNEIPISTHFSHPYGITIKSGTKFGENCRMRSNITIGSRRSPDEQPATIGNNVIFGSGVIILGPVKIGDNVIIGAGSIVLNDIKPNSVFAGGKTWNRL